MEEKPDAQIERMATNPQGTVTGFNPSWQPTTAPVRTTAGASGTRGTGVGTTVAYSGPSALPMPSGSSGYTYSYSKRKNRKASRKNRKASRKASRRSRRH